MRKLPAFVREPRRDAQRPRSPQLPTDTLKDLYTIGEAPPLGHVPPRMYAQVIRQSRFGEPRQAFQDEVVDVPEIGPDEALVYVMAAGINYNNVWAALGTPGRRHRRAPEGRRRRGLPHRRLRRLRHRLRGRRATSRTSRSATRSSSTAACGTWTRPTCWRATTRCSARRFQIWGYETNWGSFAQFTKVQAHQCLPKAKHLTWEEAARPTLVGATAYRMLHGWPPHNVREGDVVLVWGGAGGLGSMAIQIVRALGAMPIAVVSSERQVRVLHEARRGRLHQPQGLRPLGPPARLGRRRGDERGSQRRARFGKAIWDVARRAPQPAHRLRAPGRRTRSRRRSSSATPAAWS